MTPNWPNNLKVAYGLGFGAIALRLASDFLFPLGGPLWYQIVQAILLLAAILVMRHRLSRIFLRGGDYKRAVRMALLVTPIILLLSVGYSLSLYGAIVLPTLQLWLLMVGNNIFFALVEELEFRGYLLSTLTGLGVNGSVANLAVAGIHTLAHAHYFFAGNIVNIVFTFAIFIWLGIIVLRTKSLFGSWVGHATYNIILFTFVIGSGYNR